MKHLYFTLLFFCFFHFQPSPAQTKILSGIILDKESQEPVPFANVYIEGLSFGTSSNLAGEFELKIDTQYLGANFNLKISCIGYMSMLTPTSQLNFKQKMTFQIPPSADKLAEVIIRDNKIRGSFARNIVEKAFRRIPRNFAPGPYVLKTFYRHYCKENETYGRLIEAAVEILDPKGHKDFTTFPQDKIELRVNQLRRSFDFTEKAKTRHEPISLYFILQQDLVSYSYWHKFLNEMPHFKFELERETVFDDQPIYVIGFNQVKGFSKIGKQRVISGKLYIQQETYAILKIETEQSIHFHNQTDSLYAKINKASTYREYKGKYYLDRLISDGYERVVSYDSSGIKYQDRNHSAHIEILNTDIIPGSACPRFKGKEPSKQDLMQIQYDSTFWHHYNILKATPLEEEIAADLAQRYSLEEQFETFNILASGGESLLEQEAFTDFLGFFRGKPTYLVVWASWAYPNFLDLNPHPFFARKIRQGKMNYVLLSVDESEEEWLKARKYYQLDIPVIKHKRLALDIHEEIAQRFYSDVFPIFLLLNKSAGINSQEAKLPPDESLREDLRKLLKN